MEVWETGRGVGREVAFPPRAMFGGLRRVSRGGAVSVGAPQSRREGGHGLKIGGTSRCLVEGPER